MDMRTEAQRIYDLPLDTAEKIKLLEDFILDCRNEIDAQDQNMHPEVQHQLSEGLRMAKDFVRTLQSSE